MQTYNKLATQFYDLAKTEQDATAEIDFYAAYAHASIGPILEPMCGSGRILLPLLKAGFTIQGFDASAHMLAALREKYAHICNDELPVWQQFVQDFTSDKRYGLMFIPFGSWGLVLDQEERLHGLQALYDHLLPGGTLVLEIDTVASEVDADTALREQSFMQTDGSIIAVQMASVYDSETQIYRAFSRYTLSRDGVVISTEQEIFTQYVFRHDELEVMLHRVGFSVIKKYKNHAKEPAGEQDLMIIYECIRGVC
ncbi:MAG: hypothetical protein QG604_818 [Candidatus Dependentiae bacterium]|nr:hypothetical protein [Candidatus Dependentiae bacterium]